MEKPVGGWKDAYAHEQFITAKIHNLIKIARKENDYTAEPMLAWFANEQIEEESNTDRAVRQIVMVGDSKEGIFMLDRDLGTRIFVVRARPSILRPTTCSSSPYRRQRFNSLLP